MLGCSLRPVLPYPFTRWPSGRSFNNLITRLHSSSKQIHSILFINLMNNEINVQYRLSLYLRRKLPDVQRSVRSFSLVALLIYFQLESTAGEAGSHACPFRPLPLNCHGSLVPGRVCISVSHGVGYNYVLFNTDNRPTSDTYISSHRCTLIVSTLTTSLLNIGRHALIWQHHKVAVHYICLMWWLQLDSVSSITSYDDDIIMSCKCSLVFHSWTITCHWQQTKDKWWRKLSRLFRLLLLNYRSAQPRALAII